MRTLVAAAVACSILVSLADAQNSQASIRIAVSIPAQDLSTALQEFAQERKLYLVYDDADVAKQRTAGASGEMTGDEVLARLLEGTGLTYKYLNEKTVTILPVGTAPEAKKEEKTSGATEAQKRSFWEGFQVAQLDQGSSTAVGASQSPPARSENPPLQEVIVTAQKREERLLDVPISITTIDPQTLAQEGKPRLLDYYATVPGLSVQAASYFPGALYVTIRGLSTGIYQNSTTAVVIDDVPLGSVASLAMGQLTAPDIDPSDLARIEVLKGPQGTLYGAESLGGLVKYVTTDPSTSAFRGRVELTGIDVPGGGAGYTARASVNIPVADNFAVRLSGFDRHDPGYTNDILIGQKNVNSANVYGGHVAGLWGITDAMSLKVSALIQQTDGNGPSLFDAQLSPDGTVRATSGFHNYNGQAVANPYTRQEQLYSATFKAKVAGVDLVSVSGYTINKLHGVADEGTGLNSAYNAPPDPLPVNGLLIVQNYVTNTFSQEVRLSSSVGRWLDWLAGGFYMNQSSPSSYQNSHARNAEGGLGTCLYCDIESPFKLDEYAAFGSLTIHFTDQFDIQVGGRQSWNHQTYSQVVTGPASVLFNGSDPFIAPIGHASGSPFTYQVTPEFKFTPDLMIYGRLATGYRIGGPNFHNGIPGIPEKYDPDKTTNYEIGVKGDLFAHRLSFDASVYHISWHDFQLNELKSFYYFETNAGDAKSDGVEASLTAHPTRGLTITAQGSYNRAVLTTALPPLCGTPGATGTCGYSYGLAGLRLPYSVPWSGGVTVNQDIPLSGEWTGFVGGAVTYLGQRYGEFAATTTDPRVRMPAYTTTDLRTGARFRSWLFNLYINNVADVHGVVGLETGFTGSLGGYYGTITQPRTVGLSVVRTFE